MSTVVIMMIDICLCDDIWRRIRWDWASGGHGTADLALRTENRKWEMESTESASDSRGVSPRPIGPSWIWLIFEMWEGSILGISDCRFNFSLPGNESIRGGGRVEGEGGGQIRVRWLLLSLETDVAEMKRRWRGWWLYSSAPAVLTHFSRVSTRSDSQRIVFWIERVVCWLFLHLSLSLFNWFSCNQFCWSF